MSVWEYKVISSGKGGFATPALMESFLNQLGKDEWEIIHFSTPPDNALAFSGLARRSTQRDWTLEDAVAKAARDEAEKLRTEFEAKFKGMGGSAPAEDKPASLAEEKANADDGFRKLRDTERDLESSGDDEASAESEPDEWQQLAKEEELPSFFEAIQPLMRRNQRGAGMSVGVDHLAKKWGMTEDDIMGALKECGFAIPDEEDAPAEYLEYDGDLFWVNVNRRGEIWVNTKEKPRPVFKTQKAERFVPEVKEGAPAPAGETIAAAEESAPAEAKAPREDRSERGDRSEPSKGDRGGRGDRGDRGPKDQRGQDRSQGGGGKPGLPEGPALLDRIKPLMRRNRGGEGGSGSAGFLSRGLKCREPELIAAFNALGLYLPAAPGEPATEVVMGEALWWLNKDHRGGIWINARKPGTEKTASSDGGQSGPSTAAGAEPSVGTAASDSEAAIALSSEAPAMPSEAETVTRSEPARPEVALHHDPAAALSREPASGRVYQAGSEHGFETGSERGSEPGAEPASPRAAKSAADGSSEPPALPPESASAAPALIAQLRPLLKETRTGTLAGQVSKLAEATGQSSEALLASLTALGLTLPDKAREKPATVDFDGEPVWLSKNAKDEIWFNAKPLREAAPEKKPRKPRRPAAEEAAPSEAPPAS